jgi:NAD+-dependent protein deacetylase SIR2
LLTQFASVPCFKSASRTKLSSKNVFDLIAYSSLESTNLLHERELEIFDLASKEEPKPFELFMEQLAQSGRLHRHYTQNIDCRTNKLPELSKKTIHLHGRLDRMRCHISSDHIVPVEGKNPRELLTKRCPICDKENDKRLREGKRLRSVGFLRFDALLYNEGDGADPQIMSAFQEDLHQKIDAVIIVGTTLHIPLLQKFTTKLCKSMKRRRQTIELHDDQAMVVWLSKEEPKLTPRLRNLIDFEFIQDCDYFASQVSKGFGNAKGEEKPTRL